MDEARRPQCGFVDAIALSIGALRQIRRRGERGTPLAVAGLVIATLGLLLTVLLVHL